MDENTPETTDNNSLDAIAMQSQVSRLKATVDELEGRLLTEVTRADALQRALDESADIREKAINSLQLMVDQRSIQLQAEQKKTASLRQDIEEIEQRYQSTIKVKDAEISDRQRNFQTTIDARDKDYLTLQTNSETKEAQYRATIQELHISVDKYMIQVQHLEESIRTLDDNKKQLTSVNASLDAVLNQQKVLVSKLRKRYAMFQWLLFPNDPKG